LARASRCVGPSSRGSPRTGGAHLREYHRRHAARRARPAAGEHAVRGDDGQCHHARISGARQGLVAQLAAANDEITFNQALFRRIEAVNKDRARLDPEQARLTERTYDSFVRQGARLNAQQKVQLGRYNQQLASLFTDFSAKVLADENSFVTIDNAAQLAGLSDSQKASAKAAADARGLTGKWVIVNTRSSVDPFLTFASDRALRKSVWTAFKNRGDNGDANDTNAIIAQIMKLRADRARLLGYKSHAHWRMSDTMAKDPEKAMELMLRVWKPTGRAGAGGGRRHAGDRRQGRHRDHDRAVGLSLLCREGAEGEVRPRSERAEALFRAQQHDPGVLLGGRAAVRDQLHEITGKVPTFNPDVRVWEVRDKPSGAFRGLFYRDDFASGGKRSGAWANAYRSHETFDGKQTVLSSNNNNFVKGAPGEPVLISLGRCPDPVHEFGHALHVAAVGGESIRG
jgi:peptidyl-dipeptidase Dcp